MFMFGFIIKIRDWFVKLPDKKRYFELITAFLSIPVLLSVILVNYLNIQERQKDDATPSPTPAVITIIERPTSQQEIKSTPEPTVSGSTIQCEPEIGPIEITSPAENENVSDNPLCISIIRENPNNKYCSVVWSHRINNSSWSNFTDREICLYNMDSGTKKLELRVKSIVSGKETVLKRSFNYQNTSQVATPTLTDTPSPTLTITPTQIEVN